MIVTISLFKYQNVSFRMPFKTIAKFGKPKPKKVEVPAKKKVMELYDLILENITTMGQVKKFMKNDVDNENIDKLLEAARWTQSAGNHQPWEFIVLRDKKVKDSIADSCQEGPWVKQAPVLIVACVNMRLAHSLYGERGEKLYGIQDVAASIENMLIAANAIGLGTNWIRAFSEPEVSQKLGCQEFVRPSAIIAVGWPAEEPAKKERHGIKQFVHEDQFGRTRHALKAWGHGHGEV